jgi:hypothetical protein
MLDEAIFARPDALDKEFRGEAGVALVRIRNEPKTDVAAVEFNYPSGSGWMSC